MALKVNMSLLLTMALSITADSMSADDYFHPAAQNYINANDQAAKAIISDGLQKFPNDPKLTALKGLIKDPEKQDQKNKQDQNHDKNNKDKQNKNQDQNKQDQDKNKDKQDQQNQNSKNDKQQQQQPPKPQPQDNKDAMKKKEAERIIAQFADDADTLNKPPKKQGFGLRLHKPEKDW